MTSFSPTRRTQVINWQESHNNDVNKAVCNNRFILSTLEIQTDDTLIGKVISSLLLLLDWCVNTENDLVYYCAEMSEKRCSKIKNKNKPNLNTSRSLLRIHESKASVASGLQPSWGQAIGLTKSEIDIGTPRPTSLSLSLIWRDLRKRSPKGENRLSSTKFNSLFHRFIWPSSYSWYFNIYIRGSLNKIPDYF